MQIKKRADRNAPDDEESAILSQFRGLAKQDDGRAYYMVNLMKLRRNAFYPPGSPYDDDPLAANRRYNRAIVPLLLKHGGFPVADTVVLGRFIHPEGSEDWDRVAIARYRSRRDMLKMAAEVAGKGVDIHKWAALEKTDVFPARPVFSLATVRLLTALILLVMALVVQLVLTCLGV